MELPPAAPRQALAVTSPTCRVGKCTSCSPRLGAGPATAARVKGKSSGQVWCTVCTLLLNHELGIENKTSALINVYTPPPAPCIPQYLKANLSCSENVASVSWNQSRGGQLYRVRAVGGDGHEDQCISYDSHCDLTGLHCGQTYRVTVAAEDITCRSKPSDSVTIKTGKQNCWSLFIKMFL